LHAVEREFPELISNVRYKGLMAAFDLPNPILRDEFRKACYEQKMLVLPSGTHDIRFRPILTVSEDDLNDGYERMRKALKNMSK
jgi:L-lysine 6-transaminase